MSQKPIPSVSIESFVVPFSPAGILSHPLKHVYIVLIAIVFVSCTTYAYIRMRKLNGCQGYVAMIDLRPMGHKTDAITSDLLVNVYIIL